MRIHAVTLIRNEIDIVKACIAQSRKLFDKHSFVDMLSVDGTKEALVGAQAKSPSLSILDFRINAKYQSEIANALVREHVALGADWVFLLDADEFLRVETRSQLDEALNSFENDVMFLPWLNLVPEKFGTFEKFPLDQQFKWSGRASQLRKIAISARFVVKNPEFWITMGNHNVLRSVGGEQVTEALGVPLLHLPIRSRERLFYKVQRENVVLANKVNGNSGDGHHLREIETLSLNRKLSDSQMRALAQDYGVTIKLQDLDDQEFNSLPRMDLPAYLSKIPQKGSNSKTVSLSEVLTQDMAVKWQSKKMIKSSQLIAYRKGGEILLRCQPVTGAGTHVERSYCTLEKRTEEYLEETAYLKLTSKVMAAAFTPPKLYEFSAWAELIPVLSAILAVAKPRRFVELGVHNGMSFFAACNTAEKLSLNMECIAVDSWIGDPQAGFHEPEIFLRFKQHLARNFPNQHYIQGLFHDAADCFEDGSIDLLHIDGFHSYEAVRNDFETWLPKMSDIGLVLFHDTNVFRKDFGVWKYWNEISTRYSSFNFKHSHGLGVLYVGSANSTIKELLRWLCKEHEFAEFIQAAFINIGDVVIEGQRHKFELEMHRSQIEKNVDSEAIVKKADSEAIVKKTDSEAIVKKADSKARSGVWGKVTTAFGASNK